MLTKESRILEGIAKSADLYRKSKSKSTMKPTGSEVAIMIDSLLSMVRNSLSAMTN